MGESKSGRAREVAALRLGIELGMSLIDTAEMYGDGGAKEIVAEAIHGQSEGVLLITKVCPHNASRTELPKACERSLKRLRIDAIDFIFCTGVSERRRSKKLSTRSSSCALPER